MLSFKGVRWVSLVVASVAYLPLTILASASLQVQISVGDNILKGNVDGRVVLMFAPNGTDPLADTDVTSTPNKMFGKNVFGFGEGDVVTMSGGSPNNTFTGVSGFPLVSMDDIPSGAYRIQAFLKPYQTAKRSDGSMIRLAFPCGDGAPDVDEVGSLTTSAMNLEVHGGPQTIKLTFDSVTPPENFTGMEVGGCSQGNYADTAQLKHVKIKSEKLSQFWGRDMYVGANILLPAGYDAADKDTRYPVLYNQNHWSGGQGAYGYSTNATFAAEWDKGVISGTNGAPDRPAPKLIIVAFRHEAPYYDDSYAVNSANLGPYGDALNEELIPYIDEKFNTIAKPYARIQDGGSTGGWESIASVIFRPDLFGACFSSYPDSLDFRHHQDIALYTNKNAYQNANGDSIGSIRTFENDTEIVLVTVAQENHWELVFGTNSRSSLQWDVWNAVFGVQGLNGYPLEPWDKVTGEIYPEAVEFWKEMDLSHYVGSNWGGVKNLGAVLRGRIFLYVGTHDNYYLNEGVAAFEQRVNGLGGPHWANVTIEAGQVHGGNYQLRDTWNYLELVSAWVHDHSPAGKTPLTEDRTKPSSRGNRFEDIIQIGGHGAALKRQKNPTISLTEKVKLGAMITATAGRWDPGVALQAQWVVNGRPSGESFKVTQGKVIKYVPNIKEENFELTLRITGTKRNYKDETRESSIVVVRR
ncbi:Alpha/Beta hydrolase protein [Xylaria sp. CBS 124048]|nr:Alpha/Beta hydrolase protein [Xylaria sp. CBS 124048]